MLEGHPLFVELEATLTQGTSPQRFTILRKITDLFLVGADTYSDEHISLFDDLISRLIEKIERQALVELSGKLAAVSRSPAKVMGRLSHDDDIEISGPILEKSMALTDDDLVEIAETKSQAHLSAIASRVRINEPVTDVLISRGDSEVALKVTANRGARFSRFGLAKAVNRAEQDESLALVVASRTDLPSDLLVLLVRKATERVRQRLLDNARPETRDKITEVVSKISGEITRSIAPAAARAVSKSGTWLEPARVRERMTQCAEEKNVDEFIEAFSLLSEVPAKAIKDLVRQSSEEGLMILGKASGLGWPDMKQVLSTTLPAKYAAPENSQELFAKFLNLSAENAQRGMRFIRANSSRAATELRKLV